MAKGEYPSIRELDQLADAFNKRSAAEDVQQYANGFQRRINKYYQDRKLPLAPPKIDTCNPETNSDVTFWSEFWEEQNIYESIDKPKISREEQFVLEKFGFGLLYIPYALQGKTNAELLHTVFPEKQYFFHPNSESDFLDKMDTLLDAFPLESQFGWVVFRKTIHPEVRGLDEEKIQKRNHALGMESMDFFPYIVATTAHEIAHGSYLDPHNGWSILTPPSLSFGIYTATNERGDIVTFLYPPRKDIHTRKDTGGREVLPLHTITQLCSPFI